MGNWQRRLEALEQNAREQMIADIAAEAGLAPAELWEEIEQIEQHYAVHGEYPADIQQLHAFFERCGRWPQTEAEFHECLRAAGWDL